MSFGLTKNVDPSLYDSETLKLNSPSVSFEEQLTLSAQSLRGTHPEDLMEGLLLWLFSGVHSK